jgi:hypothetical protein
MGHAPKHASDPYKNLERNVAFRQKWVRKVGFGFELPVALRCQLDPMDPKAELENVV